MTKEIPLASPARELLAQLAQASQAANRDLSVAFSVLLRQTAEFHPAIQFMGVTETGMLIEEPASGD